MRNGPSKIEIEIRTALRVEKCGDEEKVSQQKTQKEKERKKKLMEKSRKAKKKAKERKEAESWVFCGAVL